MVRQSLRPADRQRQIDGGKVLRASLGPALTALFLLNVACGKTDQRPQTEQTVEPQALSATENVAAASRGGRAISNSSAAAEQFAIVNLNDGTSAAWGSAESPTETWAAIVLPVPQAIREYRIWLFAPGQPPRLHLRDIRVVVSDSEEVTGPKWSVVRSRLSTNKPFSDKVTVLEGEDGKIVRVEIDTSDPKYGAHKIWGFACFRGDDRNYLEKGLGIYVRELQMK
jgi:hypothetical protein